MLPENVLLVVEQSTYVGRDCTSIIVRVVSSLLCCSHVLWVRVLATAVCTTRLTKPQMPTSPLPSTTALGWVLLPGIVSLVQMSTGPLHSRALKAASWLLNLMYSDAALMVRILHQHTSSGLADLLVLFQPLMSTVWAHVHACYTCFLHLLLSVRQASLMLSCSCCCRQTVLPCHTWWIMTVRSQWSL